MKHRMTEVWGKDGVNERVGTSVRHGEETRSGVGFLEVLIGKLFAVDGFTTSALEIGRSVCGRVNRAVSLDITSWCVLTLPRVKSPPWSMKDGMIRWNALPL